LQRGAALLSLGVTNLPHSYVLASSR
jgi:hypothetical protein